MFWRNCSRPLFLLLCVAATAEAQRPCGPCITLAMTVPQAQSVMASGEALEGLSVLVEGDDLGEAVSAAAALAGRGARAGLLLRQLPERVEEVDWRRHTGPLVTIDLVVLDLSGAPALDAALAFRLKTVATALRGAGVTRLGVALGAEQRDAAAYGLAPYFDIVVVPPGEQVAAGNPFTIPERWTIATAGVGADPVDALTLASREGAAHVLLPLPAGAEGLVRVYSTLARLVPPGLSPLPEVTVSCDAACDAEVFLDASSLDAVAIVRPRAAVSRVDIGPGASHVDLVLPGQWNAGSRWGVAPIWRMEADTPRVLLPAVFHPFVLRVRGWKGREAGAFATGVEVSGKRLLRVDEIVARHQAARAAQAAAVRTLISSGETVLTFDAPGFAAPLAITARTTIYTSAQGTEVEQRDIRVNGLVVATKGDEIPRLPLIEPERVATPPLVIALTEAYVYKLEGQATLRSRACYIVRFQPRMSDRTLFAGRAWIDAENFGVVRLDATQTGLPGPVVSSHEIHDFEPASGVRVPTWVPSRSEIHQTYQTATYSTPIHRLVTLDRHRVNAPDFVVRLEAAHASDAVMMRDTAEGYRYLRRDHDNGAAESGGRRVVQDRMQRVRTVAGGVTIDPNISVPLIFAGLSYSNFNVAGTGAQIDTFFGGTYGRLGWASPAIGRSGWRVSGDAFGIAVSYNDREFRNGVEMYRENVAQRPLHLSAGVVGPLASELRLRVSYEMDYTTYSRSESTAFDFVVPASTPVHGLRFTIERQRGPWTLAAWWNRAWRQRWRPWGAAGRTEAAIGAFDRGGVRAARSFVWTPRLVGRAEALWMDGRRLDRFSRYAFGTFDNPLRGYPSASIRYDRGLVTRTSMSWSAATRLRIDALADVAVVRAPGLSRGAKAFPGIGTAIEAPLPFGLLTAVEWGYGVEGRNSDGSRGTHVFRVSLYKVF